MCAQVREIRLDYREATGPCKARALAQALWAGEAFVLQLDAHMRFAPGWDASLVGWLRQAEAARPGSKPVLSTYPPGFEVAPLSWAARALSRELPHLRLVHHYHILHVALQDMFLKTCPWKGQFA